MTALTYRNTGAWGAGVGRLLTSTEVDTNFYNIDQGKLDKANTGPVTGRNRPNLLFNGSAQCGQLGWTGGTLTAYTDAANSGPYWSNAAAMTGVTLGPDTSSNVPCLSSTSYTIQAELGSGAMTAGSVKCDVQFLDSTQTLIGSGAIVLALGSGQAIQRLIGTGTSPSNAAYFRVRKYADTSPTGPINSATWRRIKVEQAGSDSLYSDETTEAGSLQKSNNLSDVASVATARQNLGVGRTLLKTVTLTAAANLVLTNADFAGYDSIDIECTAFLFNTTLAEMRFTVAPNADGSGAPGNVYSTSLLYGALSSSANSPNSAGNWAIGYGRMLYPPLGSNPIVNARGRFTLSNMQGLNTLGPVMQGSTFSLETNAILNGHTATFVGANVGVVKYLILYASTGTMTGKISIYGNNS